MICGREATFTVKGFYEDPFMGSSMIGMKGFLIHKADYTNIMEVIQDSGIDALARNGAMLHIFQNETKEAKISDFLLKYQSFICMLGCMMVVVLGIRTIRKKGEERHFPQDSPGRSIVTRSEQHRHVATCFLSSFVIAMTNPATILSFMVVFSMFRIEGTESMGENFQLISGIFAGTCFWWLAIAVIVSLFRNRVTDGFNLKLNRIFGSLMILLGIVIGVRGFLL